tara:strand:+ start:237 stop:653 length:417 start_codon:yes stop_codon:yes gene_type:complete
MSEEFKILVVEDDSIDIMKLRRTMFSLNLPHKIFEAGNGEEALQVLKTPDFKPNLILLELNMPKMNGIEFLTHIKANEDLKVIPTVVLTKSENDTDISKCYNLGVAGYIIKPAKFNNYLEKLKSLFEHLNINELTLAS